MSFVSLPGLYAVVVGGVGLNVVFVVIRLVDEVIIGEPGIFFTYFSIPLL